MGNTQLYTHCYCCDNKTSICHYSFKYKQNICNDCSNYIQACYHCKKWYTKGLIRYKDKLFCVDCLNNLNDIKHICCVCDKKHKINTVTYENRIYCMDCVSKIYNIYSINTTHTKIE